MGFRSPPGLPMDLPGALSPTRYVGGNASGAPATGTFAVGDFVVNANGSIFVCTVAGSPGTWVDTATIGPSVASVFGRTGTVVATSGDYTAAQVTNAADLSSASEQDFTGQVDAPSFTADGLTGAVAASRYVGATASGAPASGTFAVGDFVIAQNGHIFVCTVAGTPGTWVDVGSVGNQVTSVFTRTGAVVATTNDYTDAQVQNSPTNVLTTTGDVLYASAANTLARLAIGATNRVLGVVAGIPAWIASAASTMTATGDLLYASAANTLARLGIGSTGQVLTVVGGLPAWAAAASGGLTPTAQSANYNAVSGDLVLMTGSNTVALPVPTSGRAVGVVAISGSPIVSAVANGGLIKGPGISASTTTLSNTQSFIVLVADGTNWQVDALSADVGVVQGFLIVKASGGGNTFIVRDSSNVTKFSVQGGGSITTGGGSQLDDGSGNSGVKGGTAIGASSATNTTAGTIASAPPSSHTATAALGQLVTGTAYHNTLSYDVLVTVVYAVTAATAGSFVAGVGPTSTPTTDAATPAFSTAALETVTMCFKVPAGYYLLINTSGTITPGTPVTLVSV